MRQSLPVDEAQLRVLARDLFIEQFPVYAEHGPDDPAVRAHFDQLLQVQSSGSGAILVAHDDGRLLGLVALLGVIEPGSGDALDAPYAFLSDLYVCPDSRGKGVGSLLTREAEARALALGATRMALKVMGDNQAAIRFYAERDYTPRFLVMSKDLSAPD